MTRNPKATGFGLAIGAAVGTALGVAMGHVGVWLPIGTALGLVLPKFGGGEGMRKAPRDPSAKEGGSGAPK